MKVLLTLGTATYLLPSDKGLQTIVNALSQALPAYDHSHCSTPTVNVELEPIDISVKYINQKCRIQPVKCRFDDPDDPGNIPEVESNRLTNRVLRLQ